MIDGERRGSRNEFKGRSENYALIEFKNEIKSYSKPPFRNQQDRQEEQNIRARSEDRKHEGRTPLKVLCTLALTVEKEPGEEDIGSAKHGRSNQEETR